ncbi:hypothetical protein SK128_013338 [Halocaridina rubra]|uniref:Peroxidase n=1 Tax=Halocaridina rubra TaxID=373956 RepID=A0AAN8X9J9_HALRR
MNSSMLYAQQTRPSALLEGLVNTPTQAADSFLVHTLINKLFAGRDDPVGLDLMALNIQRGRDHGLPPYNAWREACELQPISDFSDLASVMSSSVAFVFQRVYRRVDDIDLFPAGLAEDALEGGLLGPTFTCILGQQFSDLRRGDRFWYERKNQPKPFSQEQLQSLRSQSLSSLLCQHSDLDYIQPMPFYTVDHPRNRPKLCSSYPALDTRLWKERQDPATESL